MSIDAEPRPESPLSLLARERLLWLAVAVAVLSWPAHHRIAQYGSTAAFILCGVLVTAILAASITVATQAEKLAKRIGEPYGTMLLTLSAVVVEVIILALVIRHTPSPTLARDTVYSAVMLDINAIWGIAAILGGLKHGEQPYNVDSGNTYIVMIMTAMGVSMLVPEFMAARHWKTYSFFTIGIMLFLYAMFLRLQSGYHRDFFRYSYAGAKPAKRKPPEGALPSLALPIGILIAGIVVVAILAEAMSVTLNHALAGTDAPPILAALLVAVLSAAPEILTAMRAALANRMQAVVNIALGASLSTVILTIPLIQGLALLTDSPIRMAMSAPQTVMVFLTLIVAAINLHDGETNAIEGMTHLVLFLTFLMTSLLGA